MPVVDSMGAAAHGSAWPAFFASFAAGLRRPGRSVYKASGQSPTNPADLAKIGDAVTPVGITDRARSNSARIDTIFSGEALADRWGDRLKNTRTPDIIIQAIYSKSKAKVHIRMISAPVQTTQIAPTILKMRQLGPHRVLYEEPSSFTPINVRSSSTVNNGSDVG